MRASSDTMTGARPVAAPKTTSSRWPRRLLIAAIVLVVLLVIIRIVLDPIAAWATRKALTKTEGMKGAFASVHVGVIPPSYEIKRLKLVIDEYKDWNQPWVYVERMRTTLDGRALLKGKLSVAVDVRSPKIRVPGAPASNAKEAAKDAARPLSEALEKMPALNVTRVEVHDAEILARIPPQAADGEKNGDEAKRALAKPDKGKDGRRDDSKPSEIWVHDVDLAVENITTRESLSEGQPVNFSMAGKIEKTGTIKAFGTADLFSKHPRGAGRFEMRDLALNRMFDLLAPRTGLQASKGTMDLFLEAKLANGSIEGGVKPMLKNVEVDAAEEGWTNALKAWLVDKGVELASDRVPGRNAVATTIPIRGDLSAPDVQVWPAVLGMFRNAFVSAVASGYFNVPPAVADEKQGVLKQAVDAVVKERPPQAQPTKKDSGDKNDDDKNDDSNKDDNGDSKKRDK